jgi:hypothetical protein
MEQIENPVQAPLEKRLQGGKGHHARILDAIPIGYQDTIVFVPTGLTPSLSLAQFYMTLDNPMQSGQKRIGPLFTVQHP